VSAPMTSGAGMKVGEALVPAPDLEFRVYGLPVGQGAVRSLGKGRPSIHANAKTLLPWRDRMAAVAATSGGVLYGPLRLEAIFTMSKPKSAPKRRRTWPITRPDGDHLLRALGDALTSVSWWDDAQLIDQRVIKTYPLEHPDALDRPGVLIRIWQVPE
jgi:Holliday junction resolvase RusA-like endonuclease